MIFHYISEFIQTIILPPGIILILGFSGLLVMARSQLVGKALIYFSFISLWSLSTPIFADKLIAQLQSQYPALDLNTLPHSTSSSAIIVLGGGSNAAEEYEMKHSVSDITLSRLRYAVYLVNKTHLPIIVSGGNNKNPLFTEANLMQNVLQNDYKISVNYIENKSINTLEESKYLIPLLIQHKIKTVYLVTNAWHMPRSMQAFKQNDIDIIPAPMGSISLKHDQFILNYLPSLNALSTSALAIHEFIGMLWYRFSI